MRESYQEELDKCLCEHPHVLECPAEQTFVYSRGCTGAGEEETARLVYSGCRHVATTLHAVHNKMLHTKSIANRKEFRRHQRIVKHSVDSAKICKVAEEAERSKTDDRSI